MSMVEDAVAQLYQAPPDGFTQLRTQLVAAAKKQGDAAAAKEIGALRKPSTAAWVVNLLAHTTADAAERLGELGTKLRDAQAALDPDRMRELSAQRRRLIDELTRDAFRAAGIKEPAAAVRDDVTGTLNAAIADPDVAGRLGRLHRAEHWSGFGDVVELAPPKLRVVAGGRGAGKSAAKKAGQHADRSAAKNAGPKAGKAPADDEPRTDAVGEAKERVQTATATVTAAEQAKGDADDELADRQAEYTAARMKRDEARRRLADADARLSDAETQLDRAKQAAREADELVKAARKQQRQARDGLDKARRRR